MSYRESFTWVFCNSRRVRDTWNLWFDRTNIRCEYGREEKKKKVSWILCHDDHLAAILTSDEQWPKVSSWLKLDWLKFLTRAMAMSDYKAALIQFVSCYFFYFLDIPSREQSPLRTSAQPADMNQENNAIMVIYLHNLCWFRGPKGKYHLKCPGQNNKFFN